VKNPTLSQPRAVIIGGGYAGMLAAMELLYAGIETHVVEAQPFLGGLPAWLGFMFPHESCLLCRASPKHGYGCPRPAIGPEFCVLAPHPLLHLHLASVVTSVEGERPPYTVRIRKRPTSQPLPVQRATRRARVPGLRPGTESGELLPPGWNPWHEGWQGNSQPVQEGEVAIPAGAIILAGGASLFDATLAAEYGYGRFPEVLTILESERLLSRNGPTSGQLVLPDGRAPSSVAWIQCVGSRDEERDYCSAFCCMAATKQAVLAKRAHPQLRCKIFIMDDRVFAKGFCAHYEALRAELGIEYEYCRISALKRDARAGKLTLSYASGAGQVVHESFDLVILSTGLQPPHQLYELLGLRPGPTGWLEVDPLHPGATQREGVFACGNALQPMDMADSAAHSASAAALARRLLGPVRPTALPAARPSKGAEGSVVVLLAEDPCTPIHVSDLAKVAQAIPGVAAVEIVPVPLSELRRTAVVELLRQHSGCKVVAGGGSARLHQALFESLAQEAGMSAQELHYIPLASEAWTSGPSNLLAAGEKCARLLAAAVARARAATTRQTPRPSVCPAVLVLGGGATGLAATRYLADAGHPVVLVERSEELGGNLRTIGRSLFGLDARAVLDQLTGQVRSHPNVRVLLQAELRRTSGSCGCFRSWVDTPRGPLVVEHGAILVATGAREYRGRAYSLGEDQRILTLLDLDRRLQGELSPQELGHVIFISCVGPWAEKGGAQGWRCSRTCCDGILRLALQLKAANPNIRVDVLARETMTVGSRERFYSLARREGILFTRFLPHQAPDVRAVGGKVVVRWVDAALDMEQEATPDLVVLAAATLPREDALDVARVLSLPALDADGFFAEREPKVAPFSTVRRGIYVAGLAQGPKPLELCIAQALGAAARISSLLANPWAQAVDRPAVVDQSKCVACLTCVRICPYHVPQVDHSVEGIGGIKGAAWINPLACEGCGACVAECPQDAISIPGLESASIRAAERAYYSVKGEA
jgi:heterodisulfide reductase subunit A